jgi:hypothetical protein
MCDRCTVTNCRLCYNNVCTDCLPGYYLVGQICTRCTTNCSLCDSRGCHGCLNGYYLNVQGICMPCTISYCFVCVNDTCTECEPPKTINPSNGQCEYTPPPPFSGPVCPQ